MKHVKEYPSQSQLMELFDYKDGRLYWKITSSNRAVADSEAGSLSDKGYVRVSLYEVEYKAHRLIWIYHYGSIPDGFLIDHINGKQYDNRLSNLRLLSNYHNGLRSKKARGTVGFIGVTQNRSGRYTAKISCGDKAVTIGSFDTAEEAAKARDERALQVYGRYASLNFNDDIIKFIDIVLWKSEREMKALENDQSGWNTKAFNIDDVKNAA